MGRKIELGARKVYAFGDDGRFGTVVDYTFNSEEGRGLITAAAQEVGLTPRQPLVVAAALALAVAVLVLILVALGWMFLT